MVRRFYYLVPENNKIILICYQEFRSLIKEDKQERLDEIQSTFSKYLEGKSIDDFIHSTSTKQGAVNIQKLIIFYLFHH